MMEYTNYIDKLLQSFSDNASAKYMFIKHYNTMVVPSSKLHDIVMKPNKDACLMFYEFPMHMMQGPFSPFLSWIRELYYKYYKNEQTPEEFVEAAGVYSLAQDIFISYIKCGLGRRKELIMLPEFYYERERMLKSLVSIFSYISEKSTLVFFLEKLHLANQSCIRLLHEIIKCESIKNIQIIGMYNEVYRAPEYISEAWNAFVDTIEKNNLQYEWSNINSENSIDVQDVFIPRQDYVFNYLEQAENMVEFFCLEDGKYYMTTILDKINQQTIVMSCEENIRFYYTFARILLLSQDYTKALQMSEAMGRIAKRLNDKQLLYDYYLLSALCQYGMDQLENKVELYVGECKRIARQLGDEYLEFKAECVRVLSNFNYWRDAFEVYTSYKVDEKFLKDAERFGYRNLEAHLCAFYFGTGKGVKDSEEEKKYFQRALEIGKKLDNIEFLISAHTFRIVAISGDGEYEEMEQLYRNKIKLLEVDNKLIRKVHTYNGLGYISGVMERYQQAEESFANSLVDALKLRDAKEVAITLYNSGVNKMLAREYQEASDDFSLALQVMEMMRYHTLHVCERSKIYSLLAYCYFKTGDEYVCYRSLNLVETYISHLANIKDEDKYTHWNGTLFLYYLTHAAMCTLDENYERAEEYFEKANFHQEADKGYDFFNYPIYVVERAKYYDALNMKEERKKLLEEALDYCTSHGYHSRYKYLLQVLEKKHSRVRKETFPQRPVSKEQILEIIGSIAIERDLEMNKKDIDFMGMWQDMMNKKMDADQLLSQAVTVMKNYFNLDGVVMLHGNRKNLEFMYVDVPKSNGKDTYVTDTIRKWDDLQLEKVMEYFKYNKRPILINRIDKGFLEYKELTTLMDINHIITLFAYPVVSTKKEVESVLLAYVEMRNNYIANKYLLQEHDFTILKFFCSQLYVSLERLENMELIKRMNSQLSDMAVTDLLTGLYNRQGFEKRVMEELEKEPVKNIIIYLDLDNFKYYNDTFGHELGDYVLTQFAQLLDHVVDEIGYAVRYGGDEFVLILRDKDIEFAKKVAKNIIFMMKDSFSTTIQKKIGMDVIIPRERMLSCSIGISECMSDNKEAILEALNKADKGLYYVKKNTKNGYVVWDELK